MNTPLAVVEQFLQSVIDRNLQCVLDSFSTADDAYVFVEGPRWTTIGGSRIAEGWRAYFAAPIQVRSYEWVEGPQPYISPELAQIAGVIDYRTANPGGDTTLRMRMTWLLRIEHGRWKIVHEHGSQPLKDPYGTGDWWPEGARPLREKST